MTEILAAIFAFEPPAWPLLLAGAAGVLLVLEVLALLRKCRSDRSVPVAIGMSAAALLCGPVLAVGGLVYGVMTATGSRRIRGRLVCIIGLRGTLVAALAGLVWRWPCSGAIVAIAAIAILWAVRAYAKTTSPIKRRTKAILLAMRIATILLIAVWVLNPILRYTHFEEVRGMVLVGVDTSASMQRQDMPPDYRRAALNPNDKPVRRIESVQQALGAGVFDSLQQQADLELFAFAGQVHHCQPSRDALVGLIEKLSPGTATAIGDCLQGVFDPLATAGRDVRAIVLLTDGCNNTVTEISPHAFAARMGAREVPVYTVGVGSEKVIASSRALSVQAVGAADTVGAFRRMSIRPVVEAVGLAGRTVKVTCTFGEVNIGSQTRKIDAADARLEFDFTYVPLDAGFHRLRVSAEVVGKKPRGLAGAPEGEKLVQVTDREIRLLYVEGKFRYETKYIARALGSAERFALDRRVLLQPIRADKSPPLGETLDDWLRYHAIIFGDLSADQFTTKQLECIKKVVGEYGKGFCMIGGAKSFGRSGWRNTPIADILPVDPAASTQQITASVQPKPTAAGRNAALMQIGKKDQSTADAWAKLDPMPGANRLGGVKPAATVLAETADGLPMIVSQRYGKGRTLAIAFDTTWRWVMSPSEDNTAEMQKRFWRQVGVYLAQPKGNVWIHTDKTTYDLADVGKGQKAPVTAGVEDSQGLPLSDADVHVKLIQPDKKIVPVSLQVADRVRRGLLRIPNMPGLYTLEISATVDGKPLKAEHKFQVLRRDLESAEVLANFDLLKRMVDQSGGRFVPLREFSQLLKSLQAASQPRRRQVNSTRDLLARLRWPIVLLLVALLCGEWILRKKKSLV
jgi:uncharacterized membrane protein